MTGKGGLAVPIWNIEGDCENCCNYWDVTMLRVLGRVIAHLFPMQIHSHLLTLQRSEQSGFMPGKLTIVPILALCVLVECQHKFGHGILASYVSLNYYYYYRYMNQSR